jgi:hypothetical protein
LLSSSSDSFSLSGDLSEAVEWIMQGMPSKYPY